VGVAYYGIPFIVISMFTVMSIIRYIFMGLKPFLNLQIEFYLKSFWMALR